MKAPVSDIARVLSQLEKASKANDLQMTAALLDLTVRICRAEIAVVAGAATAGDAACDPRQGLAARRLRSERRSAGDSAHGADA